MMKKYLSFMLGSLVFLESGFSSAGALSKNNKVGINSDKKTSKMEKVKKISKKVAIMPVKAGWWFVKNNLKMVGMLTLDFGIACGAAAMYFRDELAEIQFVNSARNKILDTDELSEDQKTDLADFILLAFSQVGIHLNLYIRGMSDKKPLEIDEFKLAFEIAKLVEENKFAEAHECWRNSEFCHKSFSSEGKVDLSHLDRLSEMLNSFDSFEDFDRKKEAADELFEYVHKNVTKTNKTLSRGDKISFEGESDKEKLNEVYKKLRKLDINMNQYDKIHGLVGEFKVVLDALKEVKVERNNASDLD